MTITDEDRVTLDMTLKKAGLPRKMCPHRFRGTGATEHLRKGGNLEAAARIAGHESTRTTPLCNRLSDETSLDAIERIRIRTQWHRRNRSQCVDGSRGPSSWLPEVLALLT